MLVDLDTGAHPAASVARRQQLDLSTRKADGVVGLYDALIFEAKDLRVAETRRERLIGGGRISRGHRKAPIETAEKTRQHAVGVGEAGDAGHPQLTGEPVLEGSPQPFHSPFGLRAHGKHRLDAKFLQRAANLRQYRSITQFLLEAADHWQGGLEDAMAINVEGQGNPFGMHDLAEDFEVANGIF